MGTRKSPRTISMGGREKAPAQVGSAPKRELHHPEIHLNFFIEFSASQLAELTGGNAETIGEEGRALIIYPWDSSMRLHFRHPNPESSVGEPLSSLYIQDHTWNKQRFDMGRSVVLTNDTKPGEATFVWGGGSNDAIQWLTIGNERIASERMDHGNPDLPLGILDAAIKAEVHSKITTLLEDA